MIGGCKNHIQSVVRSSRADRPQMTPANDGIGALNLLAWNTALGRLGKSACQASSYLAERSAFVAANGSSILGTGRLAQPLLSHANGRFGAAA